MISSENSLSLASLISFILRPDRFTLSASSRSLKKVKYFPYIFAISFFMELIFFFIFFDSKIILYSFFILLFEKNFPTR